MITAFLLCSGKATRFGGITKQLLPINNTPIIDNTFYYLKDKCKVYITAQRKPLSIRFPYTIVTHNSRNILDTIYRTRDYWNEGNNIFLLGDVFFTHKAMDFLLKEREGLYIIGRRGRHIGTGKCRENFCLGFSNDKRSTFLAVIKDLRGKAFSKNILGVTWDFNDFIVNTQLGRRLEYSDATDDIDTERQYHALKQFVEENKIE